MNDFMKSLSSFGTTTPTPPLYDYYKNHHQHCYCHCCYSVLSLTEVYENTSCEVSWANKIFSVMRNIFGSSVNIAAHDPSDT
jgi:hypothetical protein